MKKTILTIAIVLGLSMTTFADGGGLFNRANNADNGGSGYSYYSSSREVSDGPATPALPSHGENTNQNAPLGSGIAMLAVLGGAYLVGKKRREE